MTFHHRTILTQFGTMSDSDINDFNLEEVRAVESPLISTVILGL